MDVNQAFTAEKVQEFGVNLLIHGHTHREAIHQTSRIYPNCIRGLAKKLRINF
ncbi:UDP-2,3-diacylglucosamine pyrophosphatase [Haemophilus influenzae]|uniref:UDP-2,3-diacylglucosamine pyrophosphatase n=1 Tax=Haemophilus influenzae TaxID=727 RepID=A0A2X1PLF3_HAEIF|nr:UDP-2,3-diacylglucosamine pyrophosphatase [Haemophilus influenzae]